MDEQRLHQVAGDLASVLGGVFGALDGLVARAEELLSAPGPTTDELAELDPVAIDVVRHSTLVVGAGYVSAPGVLADRDYWLQWWADYDIPRTGRPQRLRVELDPSGELFRDYTELPWFAVPAASGERHVTGPYVDYLCSDEYTLTFTVPVHAGDRFAGVVGADVHAQDVERLATPMLARLDEPAALLNTANRVLAAAGSGLVAGDLVRGPALTDAHAAGVSGRLGDGSALVRLPRLPFAVVAGAAVSG